MIVPTVNAVHITPHAEAFQAVVWHLLVSHPAGEAGGNEMGIGPLKRAVFLDRDGVLNEAVMRDGKPYPPAAAEDVRIAADAPAALELLRRVSACI